MIKILLGWLLLALILVGWLLYKYQYEPKNNYFDFSLARSFLFGEWLNRYSEKFDWIDVVRENRFGNYMFKELILEVTGRKMTAFEIQRTFEKVAWELGFEIRFDVTIKEYDDHDLIRIIYIIPEWVPDYNKMLIRKRNIEKEQEFQRETLKRPLNGGLIKKKNNK